MPTSYDPIVDTDANLELTSVKHHDHSKSSQPETPKGTSYADEESISQLSDNESDIRSHAGSSKKQSIRHIDPQHKSASPQLKLACPSPKRYKLERYIPRSILNTAGPCLLLAFYLFIVLAYLRRPAINNVAPQYPISPKGVFYAWLILSIFVLDWAKSGLAGLEAWALMEPKYAPRTAMHLIWHADRSWASIGGWWRACKVLYIDLRYWLPGKFHHESITGPGGLWWYLAFSSFLVYAAIPLAGLSMDPTQALRLSERHVPIVGTNQTTFDYNDSNTMAARAKNRWITGNPTTPDGATVLYGLAGKNNGSDTFYQDAILDIYQRDLQDPSNTGAILTFFSGPQVPQRVHGNAWGLLTEIKCSLARSQDLSLLKVKAINDWTIPMIDRNFTSYNETEDSQLAGIGQAAIWAEGYSRGVSYKYLTAGNLPPDSVRDFDDILKFPNGTLEFAMWQGYPDGNQPDAAFLDMVSSPFVVNDTWKIVYGDNPLNGTDASSYLGFGLQCSVNSSVGTADLDARWNTFSNFVPEASKSNLSVYAWTGYEVDLQAGIMALPTLVFGAFTSVVLETYSPPTCTPDDFGFSECNPWYSANIATHGDTLFLGGPPVEGKNLQATTISPARFKLAIHKLFGECAIAVMAAGVGNWEGELKGLDQKSAIAPGKVPWQVVLILLMLWTIVTALPGMIVFRQKRWADTLDGFQLFKLGAEWRESVWAFSSKEAEENKYLLDVPGLIGDMESGKPGNPGFIGLSHKPAKKEGSFLYDRSAANAAGS